MNFAESTQYLYGLGHEILTMKLGLQSTELLFKSFNNPQTSFEAVQIAGTNGKGSTAVVLDSICRAAGIKTGLFTSPHLVSILERIKIDGEEISEELFAQYASNVRTAAEKLVGSGELPAVPTFFEHITAMAVAAFRDAKVNLVILETGLGGRLDSTTAARSNTIAITPIALDHQQYLGDTLSEIASEKAAIIRPGVTAIVAPQQPKALEVILKRSLECNVFSKVDDCVTKIESVTKAGQFVVSFETPTDTYQNVILGLRGRHQIVNVGTALRTAETLRERGFDLGHEAIVQGIENATHQGRLEFISTVPVILLDGAHNPSGADALRQFLDEFVGGPLTLVFGAMRDKGLEEMAATLFPQAERVVLTTPDNVRAASMETLEHLASKIVAPEKIVTTTSAAEALERALQLTPSEGCICVTGSLYLVGEIKAILSATRINQ